MSKQVTVNNHDMPALNYQSQRVVTFAMVDEVHERTKGTARKAFNRNRGRFIEGEHFFKVSADEARTLGIFNDDSAGIKGTRKKSPISSKATEAITLITEMGYLLLVKPFTDDLSWVVQGELIKAYFRPSAPPELRHVHIPSLEEYAAMSPEQAMNHFAEVSNTSKVQHGQQGSAGMTLRKRELKVLRPTEKALKDLFQLPIKDTGDFQKAQGVRHA